MKSVFLSVGISLVAVIAAGCAGGGAAAPVANNPQLAFMTEGATESLKVARRDGSAVRTVLAAGANNLRFEETSLAPNGQRVAFTGFVGTVAGVYLVNVDGSNLVRLSDGGMPSFNGSKVAFRQITSGADEELVVINADGTGRQVVATRAQTSLRFERLSLVNNGSLIIFDGFPNGGGAAGIYRINLDGTGLTRLATGSNSSSNGQRIAFVQNLGTAQERLVTIKVDGTSLQPVLTKAATDIVFNETSISDDGTTIAFHGSLQGGASGIYTVSGAGANLRRLVEGRNPSIR